MRLRLHPSATHERSHFPPTYNPAGTHC
ncbi:hypothetical protein CGCA056_v014992 [Colletotrichum aenigma]|nr:hypothetical protein CGCA056_v014992 [Colletotrichum aenigma]